jgi:hypothetical protein
VILLCKTVLRGVGLVLNCVSCTDSVVMDWLENIHCDIAVHYCAECAE